MNMLEVFNKVEAHLLAQGAKSMSDTRACAYRGENGMSCAIGCLITDEAYHIGLEGLGMWSDDLHMRAIQSRLRDALTASGITDINSREARMLFDLQYLHDSENIEHWAQRLRELRVKYFGV